MRLTDSIASNPLATVALIAIFASVSHGATVYLGSTGSDGNTYVQAQSISTPWKSLQHAVSNVVCGDTIIVLANGIAVAGDATLPAFPGCPLTTSVQSQNLSLFAPVGYRTNPVADAANYGKLSFTSGPIKTIPSVYTANEFYMQSPVSVDVASSTFTVTSQGNGLATAGLHNGSQVFWTVRSAASNYGTQVYPDIIPPGGFAPLTHYYVIGCTGGTGCGTINSHFQLSATSGGSAITITSGCVIGTGSYCAVTVASDPSGACLKGDIEYNTTNQVVTDCHTGGTWGAGGFAYAPFLQLAIVGGAIDVGANKITLAANWGSGSLSNGMLVTFSAVDTQRIGTLPVPLVNNQIYEITGLLGSTFQITDVLGNLITLTTIGSGAVQMASSDVAHNWAFRGLELFPDGASYAGALLQFGGAGAETSISGMGYNFEVDRCYLHDTPPNQGLTHSIVESVRNLYIHDSWDIGANNGEAQAIFGAGSPGPSYFVNNFLSASTEVTLYGGGATASPVSNMNKNFIGNYYYKPPAWRYNQGSGIAASGACLYDGTTDLTHAGGEWYRDLGPQVNVNVGGGDSAHFTVAQSGGVLTSITLTGGGESYTNGTYSTGFSSSYGSGATASITASGGVIISGTLTAGGGGYHPAENNQCGSDFLWHITGSSIPSGLVNYAVKNMSEHKSGSYFLHMGNIYNGSFASAQSGEIFNTSHENDSGAAATNDHSTMMYNVGFNSLQWQTATSNCGMPDLTCLQLPGDDVHRHNLMIVSDLSCGTSFNHGLCGYTARQNTWSINNILGVKQGDYADHNTFWMSDTSYLNTPAPITLSPLSGCPPPAIMNQVNWTNSIMIGDFTGDCFSQGSAIANYMTNSTFKNNVLYKGTGGGYGSVGAGNSFDVAHSAFPVNNAAIGFVNATGGYGGSADYNLAITSPFSAANSGATLIGTDGQNLGADIAMVNMHTSGAIAGTPTSDSKAGVQVTPGSTQAVIRYTSPIPGACSILVFNSPIRIPANQVFSGTDSVASSVSDGTHREILISAGLNPSTQYTYRLSCVPTLIIGSFTTRSAGPVSTDWYLSFSASTAVQYGLDKACTVGCVTLGAAVNPKVPVPSNTPIYVAPVANTSAVSILLTP